MLLVLMFGGAGIAHLVVPHAFVGMVPPQLPNAPLLVAASGVAELLGAAGLTRATTRRAAGWGLIALLIAVFPANVHMLRIASVEGASTARLTALWLRLPLQPVLIWWVWRAGGRSRALRPAAN